MCKKDHDIIQYFVIYLVRLTNCEQSLQQLILGGGEAERG